jgi:hypothetical protein
LNEKVASPVYKTEIDGCGNSLRLPRNTLYPHRLALTSPTSGGRSVGIVRLRTTATKFSFLYNDEHGVTSSMPPIIVTGELRSNLIDSPNIVTGSAPLHKYCCVSLGGSCH